MANIKVVAHHEAGHAVATIEFNRRFRRVTIQREGESLGYVQGWQPPRTFRPDEQVTARTRLLIDTEVSILFAGAAAERRFAGRVNRKASESDRDAAFMLGSYVGGGGKQLLAYLRWRQLCAEAAVERRWDDICVVANALVERERLSFSETQAVLEEAYQRSDEATRIAQLIAGPPPTSVNSA